MRIEVRQALLLLVLGVALAGCGTFKPADLAAKDDQPGDEALASADSDSGGLFGEVKPQLLGSDAQDDLSEGKKQFRAGNYGLAENHFRHAVELHPRDAEAWLGLAASCDRLRRFDLADRAYGQAIKIIGPVPEILNNQGYSYMLRGDYVRARKTLLAARRKDPNNKFVLSNLKLLEVSEKSGKAIE